MLVAGAPAAWGRYNDGVLQRCPTLARLESAGKLGQIASPVFTDRQAARRFALDCRRVADELGRIPALPSDYAELRIQAALAAEFLTGDTHLLSTSRAKSVVRLREQVKVPPPAGFVYVRKYASPSAMPPVVRQAFAQPRADGARVQGISIRGRYIALLDTEYDEELADNLAHELVHAYLTLASKGDLPGWFQEGAGVYFSLGSKEKLYPNMNDPSQSKDVRAPGDYKSALYSFQYIEHKMGRARLYEFIRRAVETGDPDPRWALGMKPLGQQESPAPSSGHGLPLAGFIVAGVVAALIIVWALWRREWT